MSNLQIVRNLVKQPKTQIIDTAVHTISVISDKEPKQALWRQQQLHLIGGNTSIILSSSRQIKECCGSLYVMSRK